MNKANDSAENNGIEELTHKAVKKTARRRKAVHVPAYANAPFRGSVKRQALFWLGTLAFFLVFLFFFSNVLLPFVAGLALAYFLNPIVELMQRIGISRMWATVLILLAFIVFLVVGLMVLVPILNTQLSQFTVFVEQRLPGYIDSLQRYLNEHSFEWINKYLGGNTSDQSNTISALMQQGKSFVSTLLQSLWNSGKSLFGLISLFVIAPVVAFYMLLDWERMVDSLDSWIPRDHLATVRGIFREMDRAVAGFVRGQGTVCLILGVYYAVGLSVAGLNFGLLIGLFVGFISFIPYIGSMSGFFLALGLAWFQYYPDNWLWIIVVMCIFFVGQFIEGYILQPKLVGSSVGLHPVWLMFALVAFGSVFGFTGMLIAVPAAAVIGVLVRFALHTYLASPMYSPQNKTEKSK